MSTLRNTLALHVLPITYALCMLEFAIISLGSYCGGHWLWGTGYCAGMFWFLGSALMAYTDVKRLCEVTQALYRADPTIPRLTLSANPHAQFYGVFYMILGLAFLMIPPVLWYWTVAGIELVLGGALLVYLGSFPIQIE